MSPGASSAFTIDLATRLAIASTHVPRPRGRRRPPPRSRPSASKSPENTPSRSNTSRSIGSSSEYDQSTVARNVWWRSTAVRRPPVRSRNRSSRSPAISVGLIAGTRAAAELDRERDAVETPADLRHRGRVRCVDREARRRRLGALGEQPDRGARHHVVDRFARRGPQRPQRPHLLAQHREALATRGQDPHAGTLAQHALGRGRRRRRAGARSCRAPRGAASVRRYSTMLASSDEVRDAAARRASRRRPGPSRPGSSAAASSQSHAPSGNRAAPRPRPGCARRVLPTPPTPISVTRRSSPSVFATSCELVVTTHERRELRRQVRSGTPRANATAGTRLSSPARRPGTPARGGRGHAAGARRGRRVVTPPRWSRATSSVACEHHDLAAVRDRHDPRRPVHRRAVVVAVTQLGRAGVHTHAHPQRLRAAPRLGRPAHAARRPPQRSRRAASANTA